MMNSGARPQPSREMYTFASPFLLEAMIRAIRIHAVIAAISRLMPEGGYPVDGVSGSTYRHFNAPSSDLSATMPSRETSANDSSIRIFHLRPTHGPHNGCSQLPRQLLAQSPGRIQSRCNAFAPHDLSPGARCFPERHHDRFTLRDGALGCGHDSVSAALADTARARRSAKRLAGSRDRQVDGAADTARTAFHQRG